MTQTCDICHRPAPILIHQLLHGSQPPTYLARCRACHDDAERAARESSS